MVTFALISACTQKDPPAPPPKSDTGSAPKPTATEPVPAGPKIVHDSGEMPTPQTPIATAAEHVVTVGDFDKAGRISLLFAPDDQTELPPERLAAPHVQITMTRSMLSQRIIDAEAKARNIEPTKDQMAEHVRQQKRLSRFAGALDDEAALKAALAPLKLEPADLWEVARQSVTNDLLADALLGEISDQQIWQAYNLQKTTRTAVVATTNNVPTSDEIDDFVKDEAAQIEAHFAKFKDRYRVPPRARINMVRPAPGQNVGDDVLEQAAEKLKAGIQPTTVATELGLQHSLDVHIVRGENKKVFRMKPGEVGWTSSGARGAYAWKVVGFTASRQPELNRPLRREIAAEILRTQSVVPSAKLRLAEAVKVLADYEHDDAATDATPQLRAAIGQIGQVAIHLATFPNNRKAAIPGKLGLAEEVVDAGFNTKVGDVTEPFLSRQRAIVMKVVGAKTATRTEFKAAIEANRKAYIDAARPRIVASFVEPKLRELNASLDLKPLRIKYGVLQKE